MNLAHIWTRDLIMKGITVYIKPHKISSSVLFRSYDFIWKNKLDPFSSADFT